MITGLPDSRMPDTFLLAHMHACMMMGFTQEANRIDLFSMTHKHWPTTHGMLKDTMLRVGGRFAAYYEKQYDPITATVTMTTDEYYDVVVNVGKKFAVEIKEKGTILAEYEAVGAFHELLLPYRNK